MPETLNELFISRTREHLDSRDYSDLRERSGIDSFRPHLGPDARVLLEDRTIYMLHLDDLRRFPQYLCDLTLKSAMAETWEDHYEYWAWTGSMSALAKILQESNRDYRQMFRLDPQILRDLNVLIQIGLVMKREENRIRTTPHDQLDYNPSYQAIFIDSFRLVSRLGVSILEGLLRRECRQTNPDGTLRDFYNRDDGSDHDASDYANHRGRIYLGYILKLWHEEEAEEATVDALDSIRDYDEETRENIHALLDEFAEEIEDRMSDEEDFFDFIHNYRNPTAHSEMIIHSLGSVILNLCCLVFWDDFPEAFYDEYQSNLLNTLDADHWEETPLGHKPTDFYPIKS